MGRSAPPRLCVSFSASVFLASPSPLLNDYFLLRFPRDSRSPKTYFYVLKLYQLIEHLTLVIYIQITTNRTLPLPLAATNEWIV